MAKSDVKLFTTLTIMMSAIKITEELVTLMALRNFVDDYKDFLDNTIEKTPGIDLIEALVVIAENAYQRKLQNVPEYEKIIDQYLYGNRKRRLDTSEGDNISDKGITEETQRI